MNVLELFAGIGGIGLGLERVGMTVVGQVELNPFCRTVLNRHWPEVPKHDDVRTSVEWWRGGAPRPTVDLIAGGFPCQGHSVAGRRRGTGDERWGWPWMRDTVAGLEPAWVLVENVPNLLRTGLRDVLEDLADLGFDAWWGRIPAAAVGAAHLRWRLFLVAAHPERVQLRDEPWRGSWPSWSRATLTGNDGATWSLADTEGISGELWEAAAERPRRSTGSGPERLARHWAAEPDLGRVAHGVPARVDRLRALGNAVVPQVAEHVGRLILTHLRAEVA